MKVCITCNIEKELSEFSIRNDTGKVRNQCTPCRTRISKLTRKNKPNPDSIKKHRLLNQKFMKKVKVLKGCYICNIKVPECLDFHHLEQNEKEFTPSTMSSKSRKVIKKELRKCVVLCANHHRMVHSGRIIL